jgi:hypothetical protein
MVRVMRPSLGSDRRPAVAADNGADASVGCATGEPPDYNYSCARSMICRCNQMIRRRTICVAEGCVMEQKGLFVVRQHGGRGALYMQKRAERDTVL